MRVRLIGAVLVVLSLASATALAQEAKLVEKFNDWSVYTHGEAGDKVCFIVSQPKSMKPDNVRRGPVYFYISTWTKDKVRHEVSLKMGYPLRPGAPAEITIGGDKFQLFTKDEGAYVEDKDKEADLVDAMRKGVTMIVQGRSERGTLTSDEYSLSGVTAALERADKECP